LIVKPFDPATIKDIEKAILASNLGLTPNVDGPTIRLPIPMLSGERRQQLTQEIRRMAEAQKVAVRNTRRDANKHVDALEKEHQLSKDQAADTKDEIQKLTKLFEAKIDEQSAAKQKEVTAV
jgi:ribosome recycling factor